MQSMTYSRIFFRSTSRTGLLGLRGGFGDFGAPKGRAVSRARTVRRKRRTAGRPRALVAAVLLVLRAALAHEGRHGARRLLEAHGQHLERRLPLLLLLRAALPLLARRRPALRRRLAPLEGHVLHLRLAPLPSPGAARRPRAARRPTGGAPSRPWSRARRATRMVRRARPRATRPGVRRRTGAGAAGSRKKPGQPRGLPNCPSAAAQGQ